MRFIPRSSHNPAVESSSEDESHKSAVIHMRTQNTPDYVATPGLEINGIRDINPRRTDWMILLQGESQPGSRKYEDVKQSAHASTPRVAPLKHSGKSAGRSRVIKTEDKPQETGTDDQATDRAKAKNTRLPKATPQKQDEASKNRGIKVEETKVDAQESAARARKAADTEGFRFSPSKEQRTGHDIPLDSVQETVIGGLGSRGEEQRDESVSVKGKMRETPVYAYDGSDEDSEDEIPVLPQSKSMLLKLNIKCIILLLAPTEKTKDVTLVANGLATITPDYSTLVADINRQLVQVLGQDFSLYLPILACVITALVFTAYPPDPSVPSSQFKKCFPAATLDSRIFGLLSLSMSSNRPEEARRLTNHLLYKNEDFKHEFVVTVIEAVLFNRDRNTIHAVAHGIIALRKLNKWEEPKSHAKTEKIQTTSPSVQEPSTPTRTTDTHVKFSVPSASSSLTQNRSASNKEDSPATTPIDGDKPSTSEALPPTKNVSSPTKRAKSGEIPPSRLPHEIALCDTLEFSGGNSFYHYSTVTDKDLLKPGQEAVDVASVYTHTNTKTSSTKVWIRGPKDAAWTDVSKKYFALEKVPHPTLPGYFLSRNRTTKYERPNFIKSVKKYANAFEKREFDYKP